MQKNIDQVLQENSSAVKRLLRRSHVVGEPNMESIKKGFEKHGENFMLKLLEIITPDESSFTGLIEPRGAILVNPTLDTKTLATPVKTASTTTADSGKFWGFWDKLLNGIDSTGKAIGGFKTDIAGSAAEPVYTPEQQAQQSSNSRMLYMVAGGFVFLILLILILRK